MLGRAVVYVSLLLMAAPRALHAGDTRGECRVMQVALQPAIRADLPPAINPPPQIVVWLEDATGAYVDTLFITKDTGTHGLGNRPGRFDLNSGPLWPYGRRVTVFPVWAHRKVPLEFDEVRFQNGDENNLSHPFQESSIDPRYCRPMAPNEPAWDAVSCASPSSVYTDKGVLDASRKSKYPPRQDVVRMPGLDDVSVDQFSTLNPFDAVSQATPVPGVIAELTWAIPPTVRAGDYVVWIEVSKEFDHNTTYSEATFPAPAGIPWADFGQPYRGQPSVVFRVPLTVGTSETVAWTADLAGYGDPQGLDGQLRAPDDTITSDLGGSGLQRLAMVFDGQRTFRVRVFARPEDDDEHPAPIGDVEVDTSSSRAVTLRFAAPGDDGTRGKVRGYEVRYRVGGDLDADNFATSLDPKLAIVPAEPGELQELAIPGLLPETEYSIGLHAVDDCGNAGDLQIIRFTTPPRALGEVDACFVATAAYGSAMAADVQLLRHARDVVLRRSVLGELAVEAYYTFGPAMSAAIGESELLRATAREALRPLVRVVRTLRW